jgi:hypothetical protein
MLLVLFAVRSCVVQQFIILIIFSSEILMNAFFLGVAANLLCYLLDRNIEIFAVYLVNFILECVNFFLTQPYV